MKPTAILYRCVAVGLALSMVICILVIHRIVAGIFGRGHGYLPVRDPQLQMLARKEAASEKAGAYTVALECCRKLIEAGEPERFIDRDRYAIYLKQGRTMDAYLALKSVVTDTPTNFSSDANDPAMLAKFGMIAEKVGKRDEAALAFLRVTESKIDYLDRAFSVNVSGQSSYREIRSAALLIAGVTLASRENYGESADILRSSVSLDPSNWKLHYGLAYALKRASGRSKSQEMVAEANKALKLAPPKAEQSLRRKMSYFGIPGGAEFETKFWSDKQGNPHTKVVRIKH